MRRRQFLTASGGALILPAAFTRSVLAEEQAFTLNTVFGSPDSFSDAALANEGKRIEVQGYMAPPLKANTNFYVLSAYPLEVCPFCSDESDWPSYIMAVYAQRPIDPFPYYEKIVTRGRLELGSYTDPELGFVSLVRLVDAVQERA